MKQPQAVVTSRVCSVCGLDWKRHGKQPTLETCVRLLKADLSAAKARPVAIPYVPQPYVPQPYRPMWTSPNSSPPWPHGQTITMSPPETIC